MKRYALTVSVFATLAAGGIAGLVGVTAVPTNSPYLNVLLWMSGAAAVMGFGGLILLFIFPGRDIEPSSSDMSGSASAVAGGSPDDSP